MVVGDPGQQADRDCIHVGGSGMKRVGLIGLCKIELPGSYGAVLLCDGGFIVFNAETYKSKDAVFGTIGSIEAMQEGVGNEVPALEMTPLPPGDSTPGALSPPGFPTPRVAHGKPEDGRE